MVGYWRMKGDGGEHLARRLARDAAFAEGVATNIYGISGDELRATIKPTMLAALNEPGKRIHTPGNHWGVWRRDMPAGMSR